MDMFIKPRNPVADHTSNSESDDGDVNEAEVLLEKKIRTSFTRKYDSS